MLRLLWRGEIEQDGFNALRAPGRDDLAAGVVLRAYAKYLRQTGTTFSQGYIEQALTDHPAIARQARPAVRVALRPRPGGHRPGRRRRPGRHAHAVEAIEADLAAVASLDQDRILRSLLALISATLRTNDFQPTTTATAVPLWRSSSTRAHPRPARAPAAVRDLGVLAAGRGRAPALRLVARGGLRWSDRREDFRTEVLGLVKAQEVKNAVIVPVGAKGGFVAKQLPESGGRPRRVASAEGVACYRMFISCLLDITDNLDGVGKVVPPPQTSCATTATIPTSSSPPTRARRRSPTSPTRSPRVRLLARRRLRLRRLGGYDHKAMGITARGAWESVKRHFRELGVDTQTQDFTVVGIGDMCGDVFGNGMLLSEHIRLVAAFDHRHIFLDPDPDAAQSFAERQRLFDAAALVAGPTTTAALISRGRRGVPAHAQVDPDHAAGARRARLAGRHRRS